MTTTEVELRRLAKQVTIDDVSDIDNADRLDAVGVDGWTVVSQKGTFKPGDEALFFEIDSLLPLDVPQFEFLRERGSVKTIEGTDYHRLRTVKLRGVVSQGLLIPLREFVSVDTGDADIDWTAALGVKKLDDFLPAQTAGISAGNYPRHLGQKTDAERAQNLTKAWESIRENGPWFATEKIDGTSLSVFRQDGELIVCSRNWQIKEDEGSVYWKAVRLYSEVFDQLREGWGIQAEIYGPGIQNNPLAVESYKIAIFNVLDHGSYVPRALWNSDFQRYGVPTYDDLILPKTVAEAVAQADGIKSLVNPSRLAEGIVWTHPDGQVFRFLGDRPCFKCISNRYLLKNQDK